MERNKNAIDSASEKLSLRAKGLLGYYREKGKVIPSDQVAREFKEGRDAIRTALSELVLHGYIEREHYRVGTQWSTRYFLVDSPGSPRGGFSGSLTTVELIVPSSTTTSDLTTRDISTTTINNLLNKENDEGITSKLRLVSK